MTGLVIYFKEVKLSLAADVKSNGKLDPETIQWDEETYNFLTNIEDDAEYFDWIDGLCVELDKTGMFDAPVHSVDINY
jgi:hypothetical protein